MNPETYLDRPQGELDRIEINYYLLHPEMKTLRELALAVTGAEIGGGPLADPVVISDATANVNGPTGECPLCGGDSSATGATTFEIGRTMLELACSSCHHRYFSWRREWESDSR